jgi:membrane-anchored protein YejM (alkaline phosphatase superfamily)
VDVDLENRLVTITTKPGQKLDDNKTKQLLKNSGYSVVAINHAK